MVKRTAVLAMLEVTDDEAEKMVPHFKDFLRFVDTMNEVEGKRGASVEVRQEDKLVTDSYHGFLREDETKLFAKTGNILDNMPVEEDGYLLVPRVGGEVD
jgi:aspartyl/glutamyl-tRNA(Asn/Gln) amidotransferase C subunit